MIETDKLMKFASESKNKLLHLYNSLGTIFGDLGGSIIILKKEITSFKSILFPYIEYFYTTNENVKTKNYVNTIILPSKQEVYTAIEEILNIIKNQYLDDKITTGMHKIFELQSIIKNLLEIFKNINIKLNNMLDVYKSENIDINKNDFSGYIDYLSFKTDEVSKNYYNFDFNEILNQFNELNNQYINLNNININQSFNELIQIMTDVSNKNYDIPIHYNNTETQLQNMISKLQIIDIEQQELDKIIFFIDTFIIDHEKLYNKIKMTIKEDKFNNMILYILKEKIKFLRSNFIILYDEVHDCCCIAKKNLSEIPMLFAFEENSEEKSSMYVISKNMEHTIIDLENYISQISSVKKNVYTMLYTISKIIKKFNITFGSIINLASQFKNIHEFRDNNFKNNQQFFDIENISGSITEIISDAKSLYNEITFFLDIEINKYDNVFLDQDKKIEKSIVLIKNVILNFKKSYTHYREVKDDIQKNTYKILDFIDNKDELITGLKEKEKVFIEIEESLEDLISLLNIEIHEIPNNYSAEIVHIIKYLKSVGGITDYKNLMLISLLARFVEKQSDEIAFF